MKKDKIPRSDANEEKCAIVFVISYNTIRWKAIRYFYPVIYFFTQPPYCKQDDK